MMTNRTPVTDDQIRALRAEAGEAGDLAQVAICDIALSGYAEPETARNLSRHEKDRIDALLGPTPMGEARAVCERVIAAAANQ